MNKNTIKKKLAKIPTIGSSSHTKPTAAQIKKASVEACVMEAVAYIAGETWSDHPACACPVITAFMIRWNDRLSSDELRTELLRPLIPVIIGTRATREIEKQRAYMAVDWSVRERTPKLCRHFGLDDLAKDLEALAPIIDEETASRARAVAAKARDAAYEKRDTAWKRLRAKFDAADAAAADAYDASAAACACGAAYAYAAAASASASADAYDASADASASAAYDDDDAAAAYDDDAAAAAAFAAYAAADAAAAYAYAYAYASASSPAWFKDVLEAAKKGGYAEAYRVARAAIQAREHKRIAPLSREINASAQDLVRRMCALG